MTHRAILIRLAAWLGIAREPKLDADGHDSTACTWCKANRLGVWS